MNRLICLASLVITTLAFAEPPASEAKAAAEAIIRKELVAPLAAKEAGRSRFSRSRLPALSRRIRVIDEQPVQDAAGGTFLSFEIDARHGLALVDDAGDETHWKRSEIVGCVYPATGEVYVVRAGTVRPAAMLLGKKTEAVADTLCRADVTQVANAK